MEKEEKKKEKEMEKEEKKKNENEEEKKKEEEEEQKEKEKKKNENKMEKKRKEKEKKRHPLSRLTELIQTHRFIGRGHVTFRPYPVTHPVFTHTPEIIVTTQRMSGRQMTIAARCC